MCDLRRKSELHSAALGGAQSHKILILTEWAFKKGEMSFFGLLEYLENQLQVDLIEERSCFLAIFRAHGPVSLLLCSEMKTIPSKKLARN